MARVEHILRDKLLLPKPNVVIEHLKSEKALPLSSNARMQGKIFLNVKSQLNSIKGSF